jgi:hypothetical protein
MESEDVIEKNLLQSINVLKQKKKITTEYRIYCNFNVPSVNQFAIKFHWQPTEMITNGIICSRILPCKM